MADSSPPICTPRRKFLSLPWPYRLTWEARTLGLVDRGALRLGRGDPIFPFMVNTLQGLVG